MGSLRIKFWGTRGHVSAPGQETIKYGGNTSCAQILYKNHLILVDAGFGICNLGEELIKRIIINREQLKVHIFLTHFHWDHIQGLPFFSPLHFATSSTQLYFPETQKVVLDNIDILFDSNYSPFEGLMGMPSHTKIHQINESTEIDGLKVAFQKTTHGSATCPNQAGTYAYKFTSPEGESVVFATDHEAKPSNTNDELIRFAQGCNTLVADGHFTSDEYQSHQGWGHSSMEMSLDNALSSKVDQTLLSNHHPGRTDRQLDAIARTLRANKKFKSLKFEFAREGIEIAVAANKSLKKAG